MMDANPVRATQPELQFHPVRLQGTGASVPTKEIGAGVTVTRSGVGLYVLTWAESPGVFVGMYPGIGADTQADVDGYEVNRGAWSTSTNSITIRVSTEAQAADDLQTTEYIDLLFAFKRSTVNYV